MSAVRYPRADDFTVSDIAHLLARRAVEVAAELLPNGHRERHEWRCGSVGGEDGNSLGVHLTGAKAGIWGDFAVGIGGDLLDLIEAVLHLSKADSVSWAKRWLGIEQGEIIRPRPPVAVLKAAPQASEGWRHAWNNARPITGTIGATYLAARGLRFDDPDGRVLRFARTRGREAPDGAPGDYERHPALLALLSAIDTGEPCGLVNVYLRPDGSDRLRDKSGKTISGQLKHAVVLLSEWDEPTTGLVIAEGVETSIAIYQQELRPIWACVTAGNIKVFPVLDGIEFLNIAADSGEPGQNAAEACAYRWRLAGCETAIFAPARGDWADPS